MLSFNSPGFSTIEGKDAITCAIYIHKVLFSISISNRDNPPGMIANNWQFDSDRELAAANDLSSFIYIGHVKIYKWEIFELRPFKIALELAPSSFPSEYFHWIYDKPRMISALSTFLHEKNWNLEEYVRLNWLQLSLWIRCTNSSLLFCL